MVTPTVPLGIALLLGLPAGLTGSELGRGAAWLLLANRLRPMAAAVPAEGRESEFSQVKTHAFNPSPTAKTLASDHWHPLR
mmetsp:Transcript_38761/g.74395  ORF Transcript_38761/g.74395 Transcript_38761/m.74395 type:complete len:81 (-) Transcript_38761:211-453(-)